MTRKTRLILFLTLLIVYLILAPVLIFYSLGYRFDFTTKKIVNTGGFYIKVWPSDSQVLIGEKINKRTGVFSNELLIQGLLPKKYKMVVKKDGYFDWEKTLEIEKQTVTRVENVTLIKKDIFFEISKEEINNFYFSPSRDLILLLGPNQHFSLVNSRTKIEQNSFSLPETAKDIDVFSWDENIKTIILKDSRDSLFIINYSQKGEILPEATFQSVNEPQVTNGIIYFEKKNGYIYLRVPEEDKPWQLYQAKDVVFSPDKSKFLFYNDYEILYAKTSDPFQRIFITRFSEKIGNCFWLNNNYIIFDVAGSIKISEIDTRDKINMVDLGTKINLRGNGSVELKNPKMFFDEIDKKLYILNKNTLFVSEPLTDKNNK